MEEAKKEIQKTDIDGQVLEIDRIFSFIKERAQGHTKIDIEGLSLWLHHLYCAFEDLFKIVAAAFENHVSDDGRYHSELLKRMTLAISGVRPAFISHEIYRLLDTLRAFRHVLRHAYVFDLDERKVRLVFEDATELEKKYKNEIQKFLDQL